MDSITDDDHETWSRREIKLKHILEEKLDLSSETVIVSAHRVGARPKCKIVATRLFQKKFRLPSNDPLQCCIVNREIVDKLR